MRPFGLVFALLLLSHNLEPTAGSQAVEVDGARLEHIRALYDAPFRRDLISFDCAVRFDWSHHLESTLGSIPPAAAPAIQRLQPLQLRVLVDRSGANVSQQPKAVDLKDNPMAAALEPVLESIVAAGLSTWSAVASGSLLPVGQTKYQFSEESDQTKIAMDGLGMSGSLLLLHDGRITSANTVKPQPLHLATAFQPGPQGLVIGEMETSNSVNPPNRFESRFIYRYEAVDGFQIPTRFTVQSLVSTPAELWEIELTGCKVSRGKTVEVGPPHDPVPLKPVVKDLLPE